MDNYGSFWLFLALFGDIGGRNGWDTDTWPKIGTHDLIKVGTDFFSEPCLVTL